MVTTARPSAACGGLLVQMGEISKNVAKVRPQVRIQLPSWGSVWTQNVSRKGLHQQAGWQGSFQSDDYLVSQKAEKVPSPSIKGREERRGSWDGPAGSPHQSWAPSLSRRCVLFGFPIRLGFLNDLQNHKVRRYYLHVLVFRFYWKRAKDLVRIRPVFSQTIVSWSGNITVACFPQSLSFPIIADRAWVTAAFRVTIAGLLFVCSSLPSILCQSPGHNHPRGAEVHRG